MNAITDHSHHEEDAGVVQDDLGRHRQDEDRHGVGHVRHPDVGLVLQGDDAPAHPPEDDPHHGGALGQDHQGVGQEHHLVGGHLEDPPEGNWTLRFKFCSFEKRMTGL